jgi:hypothetical protein
VPVAKRERLKKKGMAMWSTRRYILKN